MAAATTWFDWLRCCSERETTQADDSGESLTALAREGEEAAEWQIVQKDIEHAEFHRLLHLRSRLRDCDDHLASGAPGPGMSASQFPFFLSECMQTTGALSAAADSPPLPAGPEWRSPEGGGDVQEDARVAPCIQCG